MCGGLHMYLTRKNMVTVGCVIASSLLMAFVTNNFVQSAGLLAGGFNCFFDQP
jgi:hypothetical protein